ncbi:MAG: type II toxin-antitoxin system Phd/YefM family antitoxin [Planctomycetaceae bacterium]|nr:type II toxin-antitoxin system Phd/YefM family antitoxin [Planctomycetaceae bacterium]
MRNNMQYITAETAQKELRNIVNNITQFNEPVTIVSEDKRAIVLLSIEDWSGIQETLYLQSIPGMVESIKAAAAEPLELGTDAAEVDWNV